MNWLINILQKYEIFGFENRTFGAVRSKDWPKVRKEHLKLHPRCELCGSDKVLEVHHKKPFHVHPELELDPDNLMTLCEAGTNGIICHRAFGHLGSYKSMNETIDYDVVIWRTKINNRP